MNKLEELTDKAHQDFEARHQIRESALKLTRLLTRNAAHAIRAIHRGEIDAAEANMTEARDIVVELKKSVEPDPEIYYSGYTQDALKEYVEARVTIDLIQNHPVQLPEELGIEYATNVKMKLEFLQKPWTIFKTICKKCCCNCCQNRRR